MKENKRHRGNFPAKHIIINILAEIYKAIDCVKPDYKSSRYRPTLVPKSANKYPVFGRC